MIVVGTKENVTYIKRPGSYAIIVRDEDDKIAIATDGDWFLLGGGIEKGEDALDALKREMVEESGYSLKNIQKFEEILTWVKAPKRGYLEIEATIFLAQFDQKIAEPTEKDHQVFWVDPLEYKDKLFCPYQRYVIEEYLRRKA